MENRIKIREARSRCKELGIETKGIRAIAWLALKHRCTSVHSAYTMLNEYVNGEHKKMDAQTLRVLCREYHIDANWLFDTPPMKSEREEDLESKIKELKNENAELRIKLLNVI